MINRISFPEAVSAFLDILLPRTCLVCGERLALREKHLCVNCLADLPRTCYTNMSRNRMSERFNAFVQRDLDSDLISAPVPYSYGASLFHYRASTGYRNITKSLKYHGNIAAGEYFAGMLAEEMAASGLYRDVDAVIPVPLHWTRSWSRGYNQAEVIGGVIASALGAPLRTDILRRLRRTKTQTKLSIEGKTLNVYGAFGVRKGVDLQEYSHILLVDDVFTTGATLHSCYHALREKVSPATRISVATLACV